MTPSIGRESSPLGILLADLDHFKRINDTYGHLVGDAVLREASRRMGQAIRAYDWLGRYGGEEFLIVLPGCDESNTLKSAERIRQRVASEPISYQDHLVPVTLSLGAVVYTPVVAADPAALLHPADQALYACKRNGRNRVELAGLETLVR
jgi:diguanylate cyclase (GGDEF)-like protein